MQKIMQHVETCLRITEAGKVLCHLVMFLSVFFNWMYKMKYSCYQDFSVIPGWFVYWVLVEKCAACPSQRKSDFGWNNFRFAPCLMRNRVKKSLTILALLDGFQELYLDW